MASHDQPMSHNDIIVIRQYNNNYSYSYSLSLPCTDSCNVESLPTVESIQQLLHVIPISYCSLILHFLLN